MTSDAQFNHLVNVLYDTTLNPSRWTEALSLCGDYAGGFAAQLVTLDKKHNRPIASIQSATTFALQNHTSSDIYPININNFCNRAIDERLCHQHDDDYEFPQDFFVFDHTCYAMVVWVDDYEGYHSVLGVLRAADQAPFGYAEQIAGQRISLHLQKVLRLQKQAQNLQNKIALSAETIDALALSMLVVDETGTILHLNASAEHLLNSKTSALGIKSGRLTATHLANRNKLAAIIAKAAANPAVGEAMFLNDERSHQLFVTPLPSAPEVSQQFQSSKALVLIMETRKNLALLHLQGALYDLSPTELRVAEALMSGKTPELYAQEHTVKISTVRSQLANLFRKTNTSRQTELVALLSQAPPL